MTKNKKTLSKYVTRVILAIAEILVPRTAETDFGDRDVRLIMETTRLLAEIPFLFRWGLFLMIRLFDCMPLVFGFGPRRFINMPLEKQEHYVEQWATSSVPMLREFFKAMKGVIMLVCYSDPRLWEKIGYKPQKHLEDKIRLRQKILAGEK